MTTATLLPTAKLSNEERAKFDFSFRLNELILPLVKKYPTVPDANWLRARDYLLASPNWQLCAGQSDEDISIDLENLGLKGEQHA